MFTVRNFRCIREARWEVPEGVSALVGPNGAGKSTLLMSLSFMREMLGGSLSGAVQAVGGLVGLRHFDAAPEEFLELGLEVEDDRWHVRVPFNGPNIETAVGETMSVQGETLVHFEPFSRNGTMWGEARTRKDVGAMFAEYQAAPPGRLASSAVMFQLFRLLRYSHRRALSYDLGYLRRGGSMAGSETRLSPDGQSVWSVLRNWRDKRQTRARFDFVIDSMREAFPGQFDDLDFEFTSQQVSALVYVPGRTSPVPHHLFSDGWFTGLLHLCAVASSEPHDILSIDEPENSLHPHAIRSLLRSISRMAEQRHISIILATHSPVVLNQIRDRARVFVTERVDGRFPIPLDEHPNNEWLSHFSIGDAYANEEVGAPQAAE